MKEEKLRKGLEIKCILDEDGMKGSVRMDYMSFGLNDLEMLGLSVLAVAQLTDNLRKNAKKNI
jgi:hypothetical protein